MDLNIPSTPILIGEPSETGFATRVIQAISSTMQSHIPRSNYPTEEQILSLSDVDCPWPSLSKARLLVSAALKAVNQHYYIIQKSCIWKVLDRALGSNSLDTLDGFLESKLWAIFAIGELYSVRRIPPGKIYPGLAYFAKATRSLRVICERPRLDGIETRLLLVRCSPRSPSLLVIRLMTSHQGILFSSRESAPLGLLPQQLCYAP